MFDNVYKYVKMQNYFLALASNITNSDGTNGFTGADAILEKEYKLGTRIVFIMKNT